MLARQLHDTVAQGLAALSINLSLLSGGESNLDQRLRRALNDSIALAERSSKEIRVLSHLLYPPLLEELGLKTVLRSISERFELETGIRIEFEMEMNFPKLQRELEVTLYRIVQEGLSNVQRHSGSPSARVRISETPGEVIVDVEDRGHGFPEGMLTAIEEQADAVEGLGLRSVVARVLQLGGRVELNSGRSGTTLRAVVPLVQEG